MKENIEKFIEYASSLDGDEKGEAQVYCDRLFQAFGHEGYKEAGASLEFRVKGGKTTKFADLLWGDRVLIEMKKRGSKLASHRGQLFEYWWGLRPSQPEYQLLCNFDEIWIYNFKIQDEPLDKLKIEDLEKRNTALNFLYPQAKKPLFENNLEDVTRDTASKVAKLFNSLTSREVSREDAQKFVLQCILSMFAEDFKLLPQGLFTQLVKECHEDKLSSYDMLGGLFKQMASPRAATGGKYKDVKYFNGGLFEDIIPLELTTEELEQLYQAGRKDWSKVNPAIFGTIFQSSMDADERHAYGAHYTSELDIYKVVHPTIIAPWRSRIEKADSLKELKLCLDDIRKFKVLDPACGSGNFIYIAYRELKRLEMEIINTIHQNHPIGAKKIGTSSLVSVKQFHGMDVHKFAIELAKVTLLLAKEISINETSEWLENSQMGLDFEKEQALPLDNLDDNFACDDALFINWPQVDSIIGNPPFLGGKYLRQERGDEYAEKIYSKFPSAKGQPDYCAFWFQKAQDNKASRIGLVATNSISQGVTRKASLEYVTKNGGILTNAISTQVWSGDANVHVSIVNWVKNKKLVPETLYIDDSSVDSISTSLSSRLDVTQAHRLESNKKMSFQSCELAGKGFIISEQVAKDWITQDHSNQNILKPMLDGSSLVDPNSTLEWVIDFNDMSLEDASLFVLPFRHVKETVKPIRDTNKRTARRVNWWQFGEKRPGMRKAIHGLSGYFCLPKVAKYTCFQFIDLSILPCEANMVVASDDFFILGVLNSKLHLDWVLAQSSTLKSDTRYTNTTCYETFVFPLDCDAKLKDNVRLIMHELETYRKTEAIKRNTSITKFYNDFFYELASNLYKLHEKLNKAVCICYGFKYSSDKNFNKELLNLNQIAFNNEK
jgi:hypothetical protein